MIEKTLYVAAEEVAPQSGRLLSLALASPSGAWFYAEVTDVEQAECSQFVRDCVVPRLRKVTDTVFVRSENLGAAVAAWIAENAPDDQKMIEIRALQSELVDVALLRDLIGSHSISQRLCAGECDADRVALNLGVNRCGGPDRVGSSAIIRAVLTAVCDGKREKPMGVLNTQRFELLIGTRNATSLRAWIRRQDAARFPPGAGRKFKSRGVRHQRAVIGQMSAASI